MCGLIQVVDIVRKCINLYLITDDELISYIPRIVYYFKGTRCVVSQVRGIQRHNNAFCHSKRLAGDNIVVRKI